MPDAPRKIVPGKTYYGAVKGKKGTLQKFKLDKKSKVTFDVAGAGTFEVLNSKKKVIKSFPCAKLAPTFDLSKDETATFKTAISYPIFRGEDLLKKAKLAKGTYYARFRGTKGPTKLSFKVKALK